MMILRDYMDIAEAFTDMKLSMAIAHHAWKVNRKKRMIILLARRHGEEALCQFRSKSDGVYTWYLEGETAHGGFTVAYSKSYM